MLRGRGSTGFLGLDAGQTHFEFNLYAQRFQPDLEMSVGAL